MKPSRLPPSSSFDAIRQHLTPSFSYLIFEKEEKQEGDIHFGEIRSFLSLIEKSVNKQEIYHDQPRGKFLLVLEFPPEQKDIIMQELINVSLPAGINFFMYSKAP
jgi:hypothetical protein